MELWRRFKSSVDSRAQPDHATGQVVPGQRVFRNRFADSVRVSEECGCPAGSSGAQPPHWTTSIHDDDQDTTGEAWQRLLAVIDEAAEDGRAEFAPGQDLGREMWRQIVVLPREISKLKRVQRLNLYGSNLRSVPPEIGDMESLEVFDPYTSYRLHWFPYELTRCLKLRDSTVSTRAIYGNRKSRISFPGLPASVPADSLPMRCSICSGTLVEGAVLQRWLSLRLGTDVLPLLVHACSLDCVESLPEPAKGYIDHPHEGGIAIEQPNSDW